MTVRYTVRSTTGCFTCKRRKKKCDEHKPHCLRCTKGGFECEGYPTFEGRIRRVIFGSSSTPDQGQSSSGKGPPEAPINTTSVTSSNEESALAAPPDASEGSSALAKTSSPKSITPVIDTTHEGSTEPDNYLREPETSPSNLLLISSPPSPVNSLRQSSVASSSTDSNTSIPLTPGQASLLDSLFSLGHPHDQTKLIEYSQINPSSSYLNQPVWPSWSLVDKVDAALDDEEDPEGVRFVICRSLVPNPNTQSNALPFVLQSCEYVRHLKRNWGTQFSRDARWVNFVVFEPLKVAGMIREGVIMQFASSAEVRTRTCLIANVIGKLSKAPELDQKGMSIVSMLRSEAHQNIARFHSNGPAPERETDMQNALRVLDSMMEMILIQRYSGPLTSVVGLMEAAAPVFRRACPDPPERLVNLPNILASPGLNLQHFAATDVIISVTTARPMFFKYDVTCSPEAFDQLAKGEYGLQWLHGVPDLFIILLAWINVLYEDHGNNVDQECIAEIESQVRAVKIKPGFSPDPIFLILRLAVQECWRQTVYVYLYMSLCATQADDPRVIKAVRAFVHIVNGVKPGRNPDSFLFIPIMVVGAFAYRERDRDILRRRMIGLRECTNPSAAGYDCLEVLEDIWSRTQAENRAATWSDLRMSCDTIAGI